MASDADGSAALSELQRVISERTRLLDLSCGTQTNVEGNCSAGYGGYTFGNGDVYEGNWESGKQHGQGVFMWKQTGAMYSGQWQNGLQHGQGYLLLPDGDFNMEHYSLLGVSPDASMSTIKRRLEELMRVNNPKQPTTLDESEIKACTTADERREVKRAKEVATQETFDKLEIAFSVLLDPAKRCMCYHGEWLEGNQVGHQERV